MVNHKRISKFEIRPATEKDAPIILGFIKELAGYENLTHEVKATQADICQTLFKDHPVTEVIIGE